MHPPVIAALARLAIDGRVAGAAGVDGGLTLRRAWPRRRARLSLEYSDAHGHVVAGQWFGPDAGVTSDARLRRAARRTAETAGDGAVVRTDAGVLLHLRGADRRLPALAAMVRDPDTTLRAHRPEQRAVVALGTRRFAKLVAPGRSVDLVEAQRRIPRGLAFATPRLLTHEPAHGLVEFEALPERSLSSRLGDDDDAAAARAAGIAAGAALRSLHDATVSAGAPLRNAKAVAEWLGVWVRRLDTWRCPVAPRAAASLAVVRRELAEPPERAVPVHGDLHDGQILLSDDGAVGIIDWDTAAVGEPSLDLADLLVHLELRAMQQHCSQATSAACAAGVVAGYVPSTATVRRAGAYAKAVRLRLFCQCAFRPNAPVTDGLLDELTARLLGC